MAIWVRTGAVLIFLSVFPGAERVWGQRAPCYQCEDYKENHPQTSPYQQIRTHCSYPCECEDKEPTCPPDVSVIRDGCGCCPICASQLGQPCDGSSVCDDRKGLVCRYPYLGAAVGVCQATTGLPCMVSNKTYNHGETFHMDCRTQCSCQNGTYACSSLCPNENISPRGACTHPRLVEVPDQCCREWMCDSTEAEHPPVCKQEFTSWSPCSAPCGLGISQRISNLNQDCVLQNETRICQLRPCEAGMLSLEQHARHHHIRKGHECKATQRVSGPVRLRFGPCRSKKRYRPKFCGSCDDKVGDGCCTPQLSTTIKVEFICDSIRKYENPDEILLDLIEPGRDLWWPDDLLAIGKQHEKQQSEVRSTTLTFASVALTWNDTEDKSATSKKLVFRGKSDDFEKFRESLGWESRRKSANSKKQKQIPYYDYPGKSQYNSKSLPPVSKADMHLLENKNKLNEPLLGADVLVYQPGYDERDYRIVDGRSGADSVTASLNNDEELSTNARTTQQLTTEAATTETTTAKPKKKRKKKPRKAFTSWLEFRDEEYQMDEYEDEEEEQNRKKRSADPSWDVSGKVVKRTHRDGDILDEKASNRSEERNKRSPFREGHLEDSGDDYEDDDENDEDDEDEDGNDDEDDDDDDEDDDQDDIQKKPLVYSRRKRGAPKVLDYRSLDNVPKSSQFLTAQEKLKKKKLKKEKEGKYKNQIERKSNLLKKIMNERKVSSAREMEKHNQEARKRKKKKKSDIKHKETLKEQKMSPPQSRTIEKGNVKTLSKLERIVKERNNNAFNKSGQLDSVTRSHPKKETFFHVAGKVHKSRTKRHAPRPPWTEDEGIESEDLTWGDHSVSFSVQWIVKCHCERDCGLETTTASSELNNDGEIILRRVHRTAPP